MLCVDFRFWTRMTLAQITSCFRCWRSSCLSSGRSCRPNGFWNSYFQNSQGWELGLTGCWLSCFWSSCWNLVFSSVASSHSAAVRFLAGAGSALPRGHGCCCLSWRCAEFSWGSHQVSRSLGFDTMKISHVVWSSLVSFLYPCSSHNWIFQGHRRLSEVVPLYTGSSGQVCSPAGGTGSSCLTQTLDWKVFALPLSDETRSLLSEMWLPRDPSQVSRLLFSARKVCSDRSFGHWSLTFCFGSSIQCLCFAKWSGATSN